jgi:hypothetical protein
MRVGIDTQDPFDFDAGTGNVYPNVQTEVIIITDDKVKLCLLENFAVLRDRDAWQGPACVFATLLTVMVTSAPQDKIGLSKEIWTAAGLIATLLSGIWLFHAMSRFRKSRKVSIESIITQLKFGPNTSLERDR